MPSPIPNPKPKKHIKQHDLRAATLVRLGEAFTKEIETDWPPSWTRLAEIFKEAAKTERKLR